MAYRLLADIVVLLHFGFILFVVSGGLLALRWHRAVWIHIPAALWGGFVEISGWPCPLTPLENWLRQTGGGSGYEAGFIEYYLIPVIYPSGLTRGAQIALAAILVLVNAGIYGWVWRRWRRQTRA
jgi:hypothetical protein